jgi:hypothetical protein
MPGLNRNGVKYLERLGIDVPDNTCASMFVACAIARRFADTDPTPAELRRAFGMSRATSFRWAAAAKAARRLA